MKNKGFTLVELLAVIVILAVILAIAIPSISRVTNSVTISSFESNAKLTLKGIEYVGMTDSSFIPSNVNELNVKSILNIDDSNYETLTVKKMNDKLYITIIGKNKWDKLTVSGTSILIKVSDTVTNFNNGANAPVLASGMVPIKWSGSAWVDTTTSDSNWYNYTTSDKKWANARTADGSMWVWIPRYIYRIPASNWHTNTAGSIDIQFSKGIDDNWNKAVIGNINLDQTANSSNGTWTNHPAFTFGDTELAGMWVSKFEGGWTGSEMKFGPNIIAIGNYNINDMFLSARSLETNSIYGWGTDSAGIDTHMTKNVERGAVSYLAQSLYGKNNEIWKNPSSTTTTGCAGASVSAATFTGCQNTYETSYGMESSTTGNIYGVYDMSGSVWEYVPAYIDNGSTNLTTNGSDIVSASYKYKDVYKIGSTDTTTNNYALTINHKGDALYETSNNYTSSYGWYNDYTFMPVANAPWFGRGGFWNDISSAGTFAFFNYSGGPAAYIGARVTLLVGAGL
jgi:type IV pilus assembly protein PilA